MTHASPGAALEPAALLPELERAAALLQGLANADWAAVPVGDAKAAVSVLDRATRHASSVRSSVLARMTTSGAWEGDGQRTIAGWLSSRTGSSRTAAFKAVELARSLEDLLSTTKRALANGEITEEHAQVISRECTKSDNLRRRLADPEGGEELLVTAAKDLDVTAFTKYAKAWAIETDPRGADRAWRKEAAKESFTLTPTSEGYRAYGHLDPVSGALVQRALDSFVGRKAAADDRSLPERQAGALVSLARQSLDSGFQLPGARIRPHLTVTVDYRTLAGLVGAIGPAGGTGDAGEQTISTHIDYRLLAGLPPATLADGTPIPPAVLARLACQSTLNRVIFGSEGAVLDAGRDERIFTPAQTRAIIARDRHCQYPGCDDVPSRCEVHHSLEWFKDNGSTHVDLGVLLCYFHHDLIHQRSITISRRAGRWVFAHPGGRIITPPGQQDLLPPPPLPLSDLPPPDLHMPTTPVPGVPPGIVERDSASKDLWESSASPPASATPSRKPPPPSAFRSAARSRPGDTPDGSPRAPTGRRTGARAERPRKRQAAEPVLFDPEPPPF